MTQDIRPLLLVSDKDVQVQLVNEPENHPAWCKVVTPDKKYEISLNEPVIAKLYSDSWIKDRISLKEFTAGILLHEVAHIRYNTFEVRSNVGGALWQTIDNILEDSRIEYLLTLEFPSYARYLRWVLASIKHNCDLHKVQGREQTKDYIQDRLEELMYIVRFGVIDDETVDEEFANFVLPLSLSSRRGERKNTVTASAAIMAYLEYATDDAAFKQSVKESGLWVIIPMSASEAQTLVDAGLVQIASSEELEILRNALEADENAAQSQSNQNATGPLPGAGENEITIVEKDNSFYRATVVKYEDTIHKLRQVFKKFFETSMVVPSYEGDLNLLRQVSAYVNHRVGDVALDYQHMRRKKAKLDVVVIRDVSGSTSGIKEEYAESMVIFAAALEDIVGVRTALVDFSNNSRTLKEFTEGVRQSRIHPECYGGTQLLPALSTIERNFSWKADRRLAYVITDGGIADLEQARIKMRELRAKLGIEFRVLDISSGRSAEVINYDAWKIDCSQQQIPDVLSGLLLRQMYGANL